MPRYLDHSTVLLLLAMPYVLLSLLGSVAGWPWTPLYIAPTLVASWSYLWATRR